jgi:hypothetical protein
MRLARPSTDRKAGALALALVGWAGICMLPAACAGVSVSERSLFVEDVPSRNILRVLNTSDRDIVLYYNYGRSFGELQMFYVRFRDRAGNLFDLGGARSGWFTPKMYSASTYSTPPRETLVVPARGAVEFERDLAAFVNWARWNGPRDGAPCEVQFKLFGYVDNDSRAPVEAVTMWQPGPCPYPQ